MSRPTRILVTGGVGYVGGRLVESLRTAGYDDVALTSRRRASELPEWTRAFEIVHLDLATGAGVAEVLAGRDVVIHLAALNEVDSARDPARALEVNCTGTFRLAAASRDAGIRRFVYFSTFHVYGPGAAQPITERTPTFPVHPYAITHHAAESWMWWLREAGCDVLVLRMSNGIGYPADLGIDRWTLVFNDLCRQAVERGSLELKTSGVQHRDFITLSDVGRAVVHFLGLPAGAWADGLYNLGGGGSMSIRDLAGFIADEYERTRGQRPPLVAPAAAGTAAPVVFSIDKLLATGFTLTGDLRVEAAETLRRCEAFARP